MIKYKVTVGEITTELECQTISELIEYLNYDNKEINFVQPDNSVHSPKTETINGEEWFINDGQQPVGDDVKVDVLFRDKTNHDGQIARVWIWDEDKHGTITHWRLAND